MRRKERELKDRSDIEAVIHKGSICRLAMMDGEYPYIVPLCFGYENNVLYFHSASEGKKLELLRKNNKVCFELDTDHEIRDAEKACKWGLRYKSVIGFGEAFFITESESKRRALDIIFRHYSSDIQPEYLDSALKRTVIIKVQINRMTGKASV